MIMDEHDTLRPERRGLGPSTPGPVSFCQWGIKSIRTVVDAVRLGS